MDYTIAMLVGAGPEPLPGRDQEPVARQHFPEDTRLAVIPTGNSFGGIPAADERDFGGRPQDFPGLRRHFEIQAAFGDRGSMVFGLGEAADQCGAAREGDTFEFFMRERAREDKYDLIGPASRGAGDFHVGDSGRIPRGGQQGHARRGDGNRSMKKFESHAYFLVLHTLPPFVIQCRDNMFNWVCPRCGKDVPPSKTECPFCAEAAAAAPHAQLVPHPPQAMQMAPPQPPPQYAQQQQYAPPPPGWPPPQRQGAPTWLLGLAFGVAFLGIFAAIYLYLGKQSAPSAAAQASQTATTTVPPATNPLQKYIEVTGVRLVTDKRQLIARFIVVNHSGAEMAAVTGKVTLVAGSSKTDSTPVGTFSFVAKSLAANGSAELSAPFETKMKGYELPDWQAATAQVEITSPAP